MLKTSEILYEINRNISLKYIALKQTPTQKDMLEINRWLGRVIKEVRKLEESK